MKGKKQIIFGVEMEVLLLMVWMESLKVSKVLVDLLLSLNCNSI